MLYMYLKAVGPEPVHNAQKAHFCKCAFHHLIQLSSYLVEKHIVLARTFVL